MANRLRTLPAFKPMRSRTTGSDAVIDQKRLRAALMRAMDLTPAKLALLSPEWRLRMQENAGNLGRLLADPHVSAIEKESALYYACKGIREVSGTGRVEAFLREIGGQASLDWWRALPAGGGHLGEYIEQAKRGAHL